MFTGAMANRSDRDSDTIVGDCGADKEGKEERSRQTDRKTDGDVRHMLTPADDTRMTQRSKGR